ncbi:ABC transporter substrate-binding protein [Saccharospirillum salsuginis]|uniref:ABC transporter substrate-binding protein n=1 Tax=Saccharospirillum salsuginis TaxID=418750 RepID=A0A918KI15_9GAMM|nr:ABC transporter substrate-binding protein [Saccharospirillum salsuginis]GGX63362.1 ABC transporter substrate-binding protein [Saccharospirillum salsuginis]
MKKTLLKTSLAVATAMVGTSALADCGRVTISNMNWNSAALMASIDQLILNEGFGCDAELVPGDTMPTGTSMVEKGEPDIAPEMWSNSMKDALDRGVEEGRLRYAGRSLSDGGEEGFWVPEYLVEEYPELATIEGVKKHVDMFEHPEDPDKSMFMGCPAGWNCQITARNLYNALNLEDAGFDLVDPGSGAGLAGSIAKSYERKEPWFGYYWAPTAVLGRYPMVKVDFGSGIDEEHYINCISKEECLDPEPTMYPPSPVWTVTTESFASEAPEAYDYLTKRAFTNDQMNELLAWMEQNQADGEFAAFHFLENYESIWTEWVSDDVADKVRDAL